MLVLNDTRVPRDPAVLCRACYLALDPVDSDAGVAVHDYFTDPFL